MNDLTLKIISSLKSIHAFKIKMQINNLWKKDKKSRWLSLELKQKKMNKLSKDKNLDPILIVEWEYLKLILKR